MRIPLDFGDISSCRAVGLLLNSSNLPFWEAVSFAIVPNCASLQFNKDIYPQLSKSFKQLLTPPLNELDLSIAALIAC